MIFQTARLAVRSIDNCHILNTRHTHTTMPLYNTHTNDTIISSTAHTYAPRIVTPGEFDGVTDLLAIWLVDHKREDWTPPLSRGDEGCGGIARFTRVLFELPCYLQFEQEIHIVEVSYFTKGEWVDNNMIYVCGTNSIVVKCRYGMWYVGVWYGVWYGLLRVWYIVGCIVLYGKMFYTVWYILVLGVAYGIVDGRYYISYDKICCIIISNTSPCILSK